MLPDLMCADEDEDEEEKDDDAPWVTRGRAEPRRTGAGGSHGSSKAERPHAAPSARPSRVEILLDQYNRAIHLYDVLKSASDEASSAAAAKQLLRVLALNDELEAAEKAEAEALEGRGAAGTV